MGYVSSRLRFHLLRSIMILLMWPTVGGLFCVCTPAHPSAAHNRVQERTRRWERRRRFIDQHDDGPAATTNAPCNTSRGSVKLGGATRRGAPTASAAT